MTKHSGRKEEREMSSEYKTVIEVAIDNMRNDICDIKDALKGLTAAVGALAVQEERQDRMRHDIDNVLKSIDNQWKAIRAIQDTCNIRRRHVEFTEKLMDRPDAQSWWNAKVTGTTEKVVLMFVGAIASAVGYHLYHAILEVTRRQ